MQVSLAQVEWNRIAYTIHFIGLLHTIKTTIYNEYYVKWSLSQDDQDHVKQVQDFLQSTIIIIDIVDDFCNLID